MSELAATHRSLTRPPRTRGGLTGFGLLVLGIWGAVIPFVGPYFHYGYGADRNWVWTAGRGYLEVAPGAVAAVAGLVLLVTATRSVAVLASGAAIVAGAWFVVGPLVYPLWHAHYLGTPMGNTRDVAVEQIGLFFGLGAAIVLLGATAFGRFSVVPAIVVDAAAAETYEPLAGPTAEPTEAPEPVANHRVEVGTPASSQLWDDRTLGERADGEPAALDRPLSADRVDQSVLPSADERPSGSRRVLWHRGQRRHYLPN